MRSCVENYMCSCIVYSIQYSTAQAILDAKLTRSQLRRQSWLVVHAPVNELLCLRRVFSLKV